MRFLEPQWWMLLPAALLALFCVWMWAWRERQRALRNFAPASRDAALDPRPLWYELISGALHALCVAALVLGLMHPVRRTVSWRPLYDHTATIVDVDLSQSIRSESGYYGAEGRLGAIKRTFQDLLVAEEARTPPWYRFWERTEKQPLMEGQRVGVVVFAGDAYPVMTPTASRGTLISTFKHLSPDYIPIPGTDFAAAINVSVGMFQKSDTLRTVILLTDGERDEVPDRESIEQALAKSRQANVRIFTVVVGHEQNAPIPGTEDIRTSPAITRDLVTGKLVCDDPPRAIAAATGGHCILFNDREKLFAQLAELFATIKEASRQPVEEDQNLQPWCAAAFLVLFVCYVTLTYRQSRRQSLRKPVRS